MNLIEPNGAAGCPSQPCTDILAEVAAGAKTDDVPGNLTPSIAEAVKDLRLPDGGDCGELADGGLESSMTCTYGTGPKMLVLIGDSQAWMWSRSVAEIAQSLGYSFGLVYQAGCHLPLLKWGRSEKNVTDEQCDAWRNGAINWVAQHHPAVVIAASGGHRIKNVTDEEYADAYAAAIRRLQAPDRRVAVVGSVPLMDQDPPRCLAGNSSSALKCSTEAIKATHVQHADFDASSKAGASYVNIAPWLCTADVCPAIIGNYLAYQNQFHLTSTFAESLAPVMREALKVGHV
ncbi:hypothetical protein [Mycobacterium sp. OAE908]|uniref:SGNH hydrolase domain-containing protein n=1 Tax=Mycobacterium sp. OAE908 TaxID=2817899 RepID=UPI001AE3BD18